MSRRIELSSNSMNILKLKYTTQSPNNQNKQLKLILKQHSQLIFPYQSHQIGQKNPYPTCIISNWNEINTHNTNSSNANTSSKNKWRNELNSNQNKTHNTKTKTLDSKIINKIERRKPNTHKMHRGSIATVPRAVQNKIRKEINQNTEKKTCKIRVSAAS